MTPPVPPSARALADGAAAALRRLDVRRPVVAVSGGLDSTALLRLLALAGVDGVAVHVDHGLRPESGADGAFVQALAAELGVPCRVVRAVPRQGNVQAEARAVRYAALERAAFDLGCDAVATAHTADDQAETVLLALARGAGLRGLAGMPEARPVSPQSDVTLVRPLLQVEKRDLESAARAAGWTWRDDASNAGDVYRRNRIRHRVLPLLEQEGGAGTARRIARAAAAARASLGAVGALLAAVGTPDARGGALPTAVLDALSPDVRALLWADALAAWTDGPRSAALVARVDDLLAADAGRRVDAGAWTAWRDRDRVRIVRAAAPAETLRADGAPPWTLAHSRGTLRAAAPSAGDEPRADGDAASETVDAAVLAGGAVLRPWRAGDRMRPLGLGGSRLVSDLLTDRRVPPSERGDALVLEAGGEIVWLVGHRLAQRAAVGDAGRAVVRLVWAPRQNGAAAPPPGP